MRRLRHSPPLLCAAFIAAAVATTASAATQEELLNALTARGLPVDTQALHTVAVEAIIRSLDPRAAWQIESATNETVPSLAVVDTWEEQIRYVKLAAVGNDIPEIQASMPPWRTPQLQGIILDLRDAGGNSAGGAADIARHFNPALATPYLLDANGNPFLSAPTGTVADTGVIPMAVIVNAGTHGAAEVLAAALTGAPGVIVIGEPTEGDLSFREDVRINEQQVLSIATVRYHLTTPTNLQRVLPSILISGGPTNAPIGRVPENDVRLRPLSERAARDRALMRRVQDDPPLQRALDILLSLHATDLNTAPAAKDDTKESDEAIANSEP